MPTTAELAALEYTGSSPFAQGMIAGDFRGRMREHGEPVRWWKAYDIPDDSYTAPAGAFEERSGKVYIEETIDSGVRVLVTQTQRDELDIHGALFQKGSMQLACMPDELEPADGDRILLTSRVMLGRIVLAAGDHDLRQRWVSSIARVTVAGAVLDADEYSLQVASDGESLLYVTGAAEPAFVDYYYSPLFGYHVMQERNPPRGADGNRLPLRGVLVMEQKAE